MLLKNLGLIPDAIQDMMQTGQEFPSRSQSHPLHYFFGLNEFVTFSPNAPREKEDIDNDTRAKVILQLFILIESLFATFNFDWVTFLQL